MFVIFAMKPSNVSILHVIQHTTVQNGKSPKIMLIRLKYKLYLTSSSEYCLQVFTQVILHPALNRFNIKQ